MRPAFKPTLYDQLVDLPEGLTGGILSSSAECMDREVKMPIYERYDVAYAWLLDARRQTLELLALREGRGETVRTVEGEDVISAPPVESIPLALGYLWT